MLKEKFIAYLLLAFVSIYVQAQDAGNALHFDGTNDYISASIPSVLTNPNTNDFTIEAWVYPQGNVLSRLLFAQNSSTSLVTVTLSSTNQVYLYVVINGNTYGRMTYFSLPQNQWSHVAITWVASSRTTQIYFNGVAENSTTGIGTTSTGSNGILTLGARTDASQFFKGGLDELRIWNHVRSKCEILSNKNTSLIGTETGLVSLYRFNEGIAGQDNAGVSILPNSVNTALNGTLVNFVLSGTSSNWISSDAAIYQAGLQTAITLYQTATVCSGGSYTFPDGTTQINITANTSHLSPINSSGECDSAVVTTLSVLPSYTQNQNIQLCTGSSYTFPDGTTQANITAGLTHVSQFSTGTQCDSTITTTISILPTYSQMENIQVCAGSSYTFPDGAAQHNITNSVTHVSMLSAQNACDSVITTNISVTEVNSSVTQTGLTLTANGTGNFQWVNCATSQAILGENGQTFMAINNGNYAVVVSVGNCVDTSSCYPINTVSIDENSLATVSIYPNPNNGQFTLSLTDGQEVIELKIIDLSGKLILNKFYSTGNIIPVELDAPAGIYVFQVQFKTGEQSTFRVVKQ